MVLTIVLFIIAAILTFFAVRRWKQIFDSLEQLKAAKEQEEQQKKQATAQTEATATKAEPTATTTDEPTATESVNDEAK